MDELTDAERLAIKVNFLQQIIAMQLAQFIALNPQSEKLFADDAHKPREPDADPVLEARLQYVDQLKKEFFSKVDGNLKLMRARR